MPKGKLTFVGQFGAGDIAFKWERTLTPVDCEVEAVEFCWRKLGGKPDRVTRL